MAFLLALLVLSGCSSTMSDEEYANAFLKECRAYATTSHEIDTATFPDKAGTTREERRIALAQKIRQDTEKYKVLAERFKAVKPPQKFASLHREYQSLLDGQVRINTEYLQAIEGNNPTLAKQKNDEFVALLESKLRSVFSEIQTLGSDGARLKTEFGEALREAQ
jgi:hypothetical protein